MKKIFLLLLVLVFCIGCSTLENRIADESLDKALNEMNPVYDYDSAMNIAVYGENYLFDDMKFQLKAWHGLYESPVVVQDFDFSNQEMKSLSFALIDGAKDSYLTSSKLAVIQNNKILNTHITTDSTEEDCYYFLCILEKRIDEEVLWTSYNHKIPKGEKGFGFSIGSHVGSTLWNDDEPVWDFLSDQSEFDVDKDFRELVDEVGLAIILTNESYE